MKITELWTYPIKSLQGIALDTLNFDALGPQADRRYMLVDDSGRFFSQRECALLSQVKVELAEASIKQGFIVYVPNSLGGYHQGVSLNIEGEVDETLLVDVEVWSDHLQAYWQQHALEPLLSHLAGVNLRLVFISGKADSHQRLVSEKYSKANQLVGFADGFPSLICTQASFDAVKNTVIALAEDKDNEENLSFNQFSMSRFRPNIVVSCEPDETGELYEAFAEDRWQRLENTELCFDLVKPCSRCVIPTINPENAKKQSLVWQALKSLNSREGVLYFGQNAMHHFLGVSHSLSLGDSFKVL